MVFSEFLSDTRRRWIKALKLFKRSKRRGLTSPRQNRVTPTRDVTQAELNAELCSLCAPTPPFPASSPAPDSIYENMSYSDSAYETDRASPSADSTRLPLECSTRLPLEYSSEVELECWSARDADAFSVCTQVTWLEDEDRLSPRVQNQINALRELVAGS